MSWAPTAAEWTAFWTMLLALGGVVALVYARGQLKQLSGQRTEARDQAKSANRAYILVTADADPDTHALWFVVENAGRTHATDVNITFSEPVTAVNQMASDFESDALWNPPLLPPSYSYRTVLDMSHERLKAGLPMAFEVTASWKSPATDEDEIHRQTYTVDFQRFYDMAIWSTDYEKRQTHALEGIAKSLDK